MLKAIGEFLETLVFPAMCRICRSEPAGAEEGYVGLRCRNHGVRLIEPPYCERCGTAFDGEIEQIFHCPNCEQEPPVFRVARSAARFDHAVREAVHQYKYQRALHFEPFLLELVLAASAGSINAEAYDALVPVPLHFLRRWSRQFNQAERLSRALTRRIGVPTRTDLLKRRRATETQTRFSREERELNMRDAFKFAGGSDLQGARLLIVDDVMTTGATVNACAEKLMEHGAGIVDVWTVARGSFTLAGRTM